MDTDVRDKLGGLRVPMKRAQEMSLPAVRRDGNFGTSRNQAANEARFPWVIHSAACYTEQKKNSLRNKTDPWLTVPAFHFWCGSEAAMNKLKDVMKAIPKDEVELKFYSKFDKYFEGIYGEETMKPRKKKSKK
jgi:hypothetical protein